MATPLVCVEETHDMPLAPFWGLLKEFGKWDNWFPLFEKMRIINNKEREGAVRKFDTLTGSSYEEELVEIKDSEYYLVYRMISVKPALPGVKNVQSSIKLEALAPKKTKITWSSWAEAPDLDPATQKMVLAKVKGVQESVFHIAIQSLVQTIFVGSYMKDIMAIFQDKSMTLTRDLIRGRSDVWDYDDFRKDLGPLPRMVKGLPGSQAMSAHRMGEMNGRVFEVLYMEIGQKIKEIGAPKKTNGINHEKVYLDLADYGYGQTQQEKDLAHRVAANWEDDVEFCQQLLQGVNPLHIKVVRNAHEVPLPMSGLTITEKSGDVKSVQQLVNEKRLFILDYRDLADFKLHEDKFFYAAVMLVYREILEDNTSRLNVLGIQLDPSSDEIFTPDMPQKNRYKLAKMFVACADNQVHEFLYHLCFGHLGIEGAVVAIHNRLPKASKKNPDVKTHPLRALLEPHLHDTIGINYMGREILVPEKYPITDKPFSIGTEQGIKLASKGWQRWDFFKSSFPEDLKARGFDEAGTDGVQNYLYRDDGFKLWNALGDYTTDAVNHIYADDEAVKADSDLQKWSDEMSAKDGAAYPGFPETIGTKKLLAHVLQIIIWNASALHSILDFPQWHYVGLIPNRPNAIYLPMPPLGEDKADIDEDYIKRSLAPKLATLFQTTFPWLLSLPSETPLTELASLKGIHDEVDATFQKNLDKISEEIKVRNAKLEAEGKAPYLFLLPERVASSVDI